MNEQPNPTEGNRRFKVLRTAASGFAMGAADIVPGVSGGTVALVLGVYQRLLTAISRIDSKFVGLLLRREFHQAAKHADLGFLVTLGTGILVGVVGLASLMEHLLTHHRSLTYALFFGLILASAFLVGRLVRPHCGRERVVCCLLGLVAASFAAWIATLGHLAAIPGHTYTFFCGAIAICAMILPGISGAHLLLILGKYEEMTGMIKALPRGEVTAAELVAIAIFCAGCLTGLLLFSRVIRWLLEHYAAPTLAALCGFMVGSLLRVWPFQIDTTPDVQELKQKLFEPYWPTAWTSDVVWAFGLAIVGFAMVLFADRAASGCRAEKTEAT